ncbi:MAG: recombination mediator RecR [Caulobacterales bacterium]
MRGSRTTPTASPEIERLISQLAKVPGLGPRSARRAALQLLKKRDVLMVPLAEAIAQAAAAVKTCSTCGALDTTDPCHLCVAPERDDGVICVVAEVGDVWALERAAGYRGRYHVLGGVLSALDGIGPDELRIDSLAARVGQGGVREVILALAATVDGQTTSHVITQRLASFGVHVTRLSHGVPVGGELELMDDGTLFAALQSRRPL